ARKVGGARTVKAERMCRWPLDRAAAPEPQVFSLDEPTLEVVVQSRRAIWDHILSLRDQGKTVLITTNYLEEAQALCERLAIIDHGKLVAVDTPSHLEHVYGGGVVELETDQPIGNVEALRALPGVKEVQQEGTHLRVTTE